MSLSVISKRDAHESHLQNLKIKSRHSNQQVDDHVDVVMMIVWNCYLFLDGTNQWSNRKSDKKVYIEKY